MKKVTLILAMFLGFVAFGQDKLAQVEKMSGLDVFVMNQPVAQYKIVVRMKPISLANLNLKTLVTGGIIRETASDKMNQYVNQVLRQADKEDVHVDAVIYSGGKGNRRRHYRQRCQGGRNQLGADPLQLSRPEHGPGDQRPVDGRHVHGADGYAGHQADLPAELRDGGGRGRLALGLTADQPLRRERRHLRLR